MESFKTKSFTLNWGFLIKIVVGHKVGNGFVMIKICGEITCMDFSKFEHWFAVQNEVLQTISNHIMNFL